MKNDDFEDMINEIKNGIKITPQAFKIGDAAILGMLYEVSASPSPGLVSPISNGAHNDMDFFLFLKSTSSIAYVMYICSQIGIDYEDKLLQRLRCVGKLGEERMLDETNGVNTQKGLLFLAGILCGAAGSCIRLKKILNRENISLECKNICGNIVENELKSLNANVCTENRNGNQNNTDNCLAKNNKLTNGEKLYLKYGITGIRGEIENGLPSIIYVGLPYYESALKSGLPACAAIAHALVALMSVVEDTTVINRCGIEGLNYMKNSAVHALKLGGMQTTEGVDFIKQMDIDFIKRKISPGGAADLLAATVLVKKLEEDFQREI